MSKSNVEGQGPGPRPQQHASRIALTLDRLLAQPEGRAWLKAARGRVPAWLRDQDDAATAEAVRFLEVAAKVLDTSVDDSTISELPGWVRLGVLHTYAAWQTSEGTTCMHAPHPARPEPVFAVAWRPGLVACRRCIHLTALRPGSVPDRTCDGCGHVAAGLEQGEGIHPCQVQYGPMVFGFGACAPCHTEALAVRA